LGVAGGNQRPGLPTDALKCLAVAQTTAWQRKRSISCRQDTPMTSERANLCNGGLLC
jgi:hypothetical protein